MARFYTDVAEWIMNSSIYCHDGEGREDPCLTEDGACRNTVVEYSFQFLEDFQEECPKFPFHGLNILESSRYMWTTAMLYIIMYLDFSPGM